MLNVIKSPTSSSEEANMYVLKFPIKLWHIVNECTSRAIHWGAYGRTIKLNYALFQREYLDCDVPKFKTRNVTSFIRQLNLYGFKKFQTGNKTTLYRNQSDHEFYHENFRFGRPDLLHFIKRRVIPLKVTRGTGFPTIHRMSKQEVYRREFQNALLSSRLLHGFLRAKSSKEVYGELQDSDSQASPYRAKLIPAENLNYNADSCEITLEIDYDYNSLILYDPSKTLDLDDGEGDDMFVSEKVKSYESSVEVENDYDESTYVINISRDQDCITSEEYEENKQINNGDEEMNEADSLPTLHIPEPESFDCEIINCLSNAFSVLH